MQNRFGFKDLVMAVLLVAILVSVWIAMKQYDRQWRHVQNLVSSVDQLTTQQARLNRELGVLNGLIEGGAIVQGSDKSQSANTKGGTVAMGKVGGAFDELRAAKAEADYADGDWLVESFGVSPPSLTPLLAGDVYQQIIEARVLETLAVQDPTTLEWRPLLAESWEKDEENLTIRFKLRRGVTFSDGEELTADDVVFTYDWIMNPKVAAPRQRAYLKRIVAVEKIGPYEVEFRYGEPYFEWFGLAASVAVMPKHFYGRFTPEEFNKQTGLLMGSGAYRLPDPESWRPGDPLVLVRNARYWGEPGAFDRLVYKIIEQNAAELTAFRNREIDILGALPEQYVKLIEDKEFMDRVRRYELDHVRTGYGYIAWNQRRSGEATMFADKRVRQAMTMLINRQRICDEVYLGYARVATGPFHHLNSQSNPDVTAWEHDVTRGLALLKDAGFERDKDGVMRRVNGGTNGENAGENMDRAGENVGGNVGGALRFKYTYVVGNEVSQRMMLMIKDDLARVGVELEPDPVKWSGLVKKIETRDYEAMTLGWGSSIESDIFQMFHSSQIEDNGDNFVGYASEELDAVLDQARKELDYDKRMKLWQQAHAILHEDQPYTFMTRRIGLMFMDKRIKNVQRSKAGFNYVSRWYMPIPWYVPADEQIAR